MVENMARKPSTKLVGEKRPISRGQMLVSFWVFLLGTLCLNLDLGEEDQESTKISRFLSNMDLGHGFSNGCNDF